MSISTVFLDAGGVLVVPNWHRVAQALGAQGVTVTPEALAAADPIARHELDMGLAPKATDQKRGFLYFNRVLELSGIVPSERTEAALDDLQAYHARINLWETVPDGVPDALERMRAMGLRLAVVSNANGKLRVLFDRVGLSRHFEVMLDSTEEGVEKPDRRLFDLAVERMGAKTRGGPALRRPVHGGRRGGPRRRPPGHPAGPPRPLRRLRLRAGAFARRTRGPARQSALIQSRSSLGLTIVLPHGDSSAVGPVAKGDCDGCEPEPGAAGPAAAFRGRGGDRQHN